MTKQQRLQYVIDYFSKHMPDAATELVYGNTYELLVAVILSAQCTDKRVNMVTPAFFRQYPDIPSLAKGSVADIFELIKSISYPNNKSKHLKGMAERVRDVYAGEIPMTVEELVTLPGVGRKTANVITSVVDRQPNMAVDTHVFRVSHRIGLVPSTAKTPLATEKALIKMLPRELVHQAHHWLILHGRYTCLARVPNCDNCPIQVCCRYHDKYLLKNL